MSSYLEKADVIRRPFECFYFDTEVNMFPVPAHSHYYMEMVMVLEGSVLVTSNGRKYTARENDMVMIYPNAEHSYNPLDEKKLRAAVFKLDISRLDLSSVYSPKTRSIALKLEEERTDIVIAAEDIKAIPCRTLFERCIEEVQEERFGFDQIVRASISVLMTELFRYYLRKGFTLDVDTYAMDDQYDIYCVTEYILQNIGSNIRVEDVARICGMSYSGFARKFKETYGMTCKEYMDELRIGRVEEMLSYTDFDLNRIAQECGYSDCSHLINCFKKCKGITPAKFRERKKWSQK